jgi:dolichol-phosphate mannosyltransferase
MDAILKQPSRMLEILKISRLARYRFVKFGAVGFSGTILNLAVLYISQEILFKNIYPPGIRLNFSLSTAIFIATFHNYMLNRIWTWSDRKGVIRKNFFIQLMQYYAACWFAIFLQLILPKVFAYFVHYLIANVLSIILSTVLNYVLNDRWTFAVNRHDPMIRPSELCQNSAHKIMAIDQK